MEKDIVKAETEESERDEELFQDIEEDEEEESIPRRRFASDSIPTMFLSKLGDILILHFAFLVCSLPLVTVGASLSAVSYVGMKMAAGMDGFVLSNFWKGFRENFKRSTLYWLACVLIGAAIWFSYQYWAAIGGMVGMVLGCVSVVLAILLGMTMLYIFAVQAKFYNTIKATVKNAFLMSVRHFHITVLMIVCLLFVSYLMVNFSVMQALGSVTGAGLLGLIFGKLYNVVFASYE